MDSAFWYVDEYELAGRRVWAAWVHRSNLHQVERWLRLQGAGVTGLHVRDLGPIAERGVSMGTLEGDVLHFGLGSWVLTDGRGDFWSLPASATSSLRPVFSQEGRTSRTVA